MGVQPITEYRAYEQGRESPTQWDAEPLQPHRRPRTPSPNPITQVYPFCTALNIHYLADFGNCAAAGPQLTRLMLCCVSDVPAE